MNTEEMALNALLGDLFKHFEEHKKEMGKQTLPSY